MTRMTGPDCAVMCNLINTHTHTRTGSGRGEERRSSTFIPHASSSMKTKDSACGHSTALFPRPAACTRASHRGDNRVPGMERS